MIDTNNFSVKYPDNVCLICGAEIPEGRMICPICGTRGGVEGLRDALGGKHTAKQEAFTREITFSIDCQLQKAYNAGYVEGFKKGTEHYHDTRTENERLRRENALLRSQIESWSRIDDLDGEYE